MKQSLVLLGGLVFAAGCQVHGLGAGGGGSTTSVGAGGAGGGGASAPSGGGDIARASGAEGHRTITVPETNGLSVTEAKQKLRAAGVTGEITVDGNDHDDPRYRTCGTTPGAGHETSASLSISLTVCETEAGEDQDKRDADAKIVHFRGMSLDRAKAVALKDGFDGKFEIRELNEYDASCPSDGVTVCRADPEQLPIQGHLLTLWTNHKTSIAIPQ